MRGKKAKMLRKLAQAATIGQQAVDYDVVRAMDGNGNPAVQKWITGTNEDGTPEITEVPCNTVKLSDECTRSTYKRMKERVK